MPSRPKFLIFAFPFTFFSTSTVVLKIETYASASESSHRILDEKPLKENNKMQFEPKCVKFPRHSQPEPLGSKHLGRCWQPSSNEPTGWAAGTAVLSLSTYQTSPSSLLSTKGLPTWGFVLNEKRLWRWLQQNSSLLKVQPICPVALALDQSLCPLSRAGVWMIHMIGSKDTIKSCEAFSLLWCLVSLTLYLYASSFCSPGRRPPQWRSLFTSVWGRSLIAGQRVKVTLIKWWRLFFSTLGITVYEQPWWKVNANHVFTAICLYYIHI